LVAVEAKELVTMGVLCEVKGTDRYTRVATLGDALASTCSVEVARELGEATGWTVAGYSSFEEAADAVADGAAQALLVPGAYRMFDKFVFDERLRLERVEIVPIPAIVLIGGGVFESGVAVTMYHHASLTSVVDGLEARSSPTFDRSLVASNPIACERALADPDSVALTNGLAAQRYGRPRSNSVKPTIGTVDLG
jgi:hypothetical protein